MTRKKLCGVGLIIAALIAIAVILKSNKTVFYNDKDFLEQSFNLQHIEECTYTVNTVGNPRSIGPNDYEYFVFAKCSDAETNRIRSTYSFEEAIPRFGISPTPTRKAIKHFSDRDIFPFENYNWGHSMELEDYVLEKSNCIGEVYFDTLNGCIYMWVSTT